MKKQDVISSLEQHKTWSSGQPLVRDPDDRLDQQGPGSAGCKAVIVLALAAAAAILVITLVEG